MAQMAFYVVCKNGHKKCLSYWLFLDSNPYLIQTALKTCFGQLADVKQAEA